MHQLGIPIPAFPVLFWAGAVAFGDAALLAHAFVLSTVAGTAGNVPWYWAGRRYGHRILKLVCRVTLSPDSCARQTERQAAKLYHMGLREAVHRSTLADANEARDWRIWADFAQMLIRKARRLYASDSLGVELSNTVYALDSTTIDLCLSVFPWARFNRPSPR